MAGNKRIPLTLGIGGEVIGSGMVDENGLFMGEIDDIELTRELFPQNLSLSIYVPEKSDG